MLYRRFASAGCRSGEVPLALLQGWGRIYVRTKAAVLSLPVMIWNTTQRKRVGISTGGAAILFEVPRHEDGANRQTQPCQRNHRTPSTWPPAPLLYFLLNIFRNYSDFFCPFIPPSDRASWRWKQLKIMINHKENSSFSRSTVPNSEQTQQPRGTRDISKYSKYSMGRLGCANILHVGNSQ